MSGKAKKKTTEPVKKSVVKDSKKTPVPKKLRLTDIQGVGPKLADNLTAGGFKTVASLSKATPERLMKKVEGIGEVTAVRIIDAAKKLIEKGPAEKTIKKSRQVKAKAKRTAPTKKKVVSGELEDLAKELESDDQQVLLGAIDRLGVLDDPGAAQYLIECLKHPKYIVRIHAAAQLGERKDKIAIDPLIDTLHDESVFVRQTAAGALENIGGAKAKKAISMAEAEGLLLDDLPEGRRLEQK